MILALYNILYFLHLSEHILVRPSNYILQLVVAGIIEI